jgi:hypothetical protein
VNGALHSVSREQNDESLHLPPVTEFDGIAFVAALIGAAGGFLGGGRPVKSNKI